MQRLQYCLAQCNQGVLGLITSPKPEMVSYIDGNKGVAWTGTTLENKTLPNTQQKGCSGSNRVRIGDAWSSRTPHVIKRLKKADIMTKGSLDVKKAIALLSNSQLFLPLE
jgi:hypothetical protein